MIHPDSEGRDGQKWGSKDVLRMGIGLESSLIFRKDPYFVTETKSFFYVCSGGVIKSFLSDQEPWEFQTTTQPAGSLKYPRAPQR